jgi:hypothetical protein
MAGRQSARRSHEIDNFADNFYFRQEKIAGHGVARLSATTTSVRPLPAATMPLLLR